jgi:hypothetical protein
MGNKFHNQDFLFYSSIATHIISTSTMFRKFSTVKQQH